MISCRVQYFLFEQLGSRPNNKYTNIATFYYIQFFKNIQDGRIFWQSNYDENVTKKKNPFQKFKSFR